MIKNDLQFSGSRGEVEHDTMTDGKLKVCRASAGSGKTFKLAVEYIKHLVKAPDAFRHILAVTFTNKATTEMKTRILSQLYGISHGLIDSDSYMQKLLEDEDIQQWYASKQRIKPLAELIRENCAKALSMIIHEYHYFRIETIDSFFQSIIRELAHDLGLTANLRVDLDSEAALKEGVDALIDSVRTDKTTEQNVLTFIEAKIAENKNWSINNDLQKFGKNIFNENFLQFGQDLRKKLENPDFLKNFRAKIMAMKEEAPKILVNYGEKFIAICNSNNLGMNDFAGKSKGPYTFFQKLAEGGIPNVTDTAKKWAADANNWSKDAGVLSVVTNEHLVEYLNNTIEKINDVNRVLNSVNAIEKHLYSLSLINTISKKVDEVTSQRGDFLLSNTNHFLNEMIEESDVPFIYERTGTRFTHIMIDEFQDTSVLQWENFKPLIKNCLDDNNECLIVGDVKQSIYRWRNGEWSILNNIQEDATFKDYVNPDPLDTNYRSDARVIRFNNAFFDSAKAVLSKAYQAEIAADSQAIENAYLNAAQKVPEGKDPQKGYVRIECMQRIEDKEAESDLIPGMNKYGSWQCRRLGENVKTLLEAGIPQTQMAILVRTKKQIAQICDYFDNYMEPVDGERVSVVSSEAYQLSASPAVRVIIQALKMIQNPDDRLSVALFLYYYQTHVEGKSDCSDLLMKDVESMKEMLPEEFRKEMGTITMVPLYELCERLYGMLHLNKIQHQDSYLFAFFDQLRKYLEDGNTDLDSFLTYWDEKLSQVTISDGTVNGIRIMTIHKAKGLEFHSVLLPFASWKVQEIEKADLLWCVSEEEPYDELLLSPVNASKALADSAFSKDYQEELLKEYVDNLNLLYVAFTRATHNLIVVSDLYDASASSKKPSSAYKTMYDLLRKAMPEEIENAGTIKMTSDDDIQADVFEYADSEIVGYQAKETTTENVLLKSPERDDIRFGSSLSGGEFRQSNRSRLFVAGLDDDSPQVKYQNEGLVLHRILSEVRTADDLDKVVRQLDFEGCFADPYYREQVRNLVRKAFENQQARGWFSPRWTVINECTIVYEEDGAVKERRPDRVITDGEQTIVIDYKTGYKQSDDYKQQVSKYMELLEQMGYQNVSGYLWYIRRNEIVRV